jgi:cation-dependent mannose-6-phosphate receptor
VSTKYLVLSFQLTHARSALIAIAAYLVGGCAYQRTVMHQRGWRQCPNYSLWAGMLDFVKVCVLAVTPFRRTYRRHRDSLSHNHPSNAKLPVSRLD